MIKILFVGITGAMGQTILNTLPKDIEVVGGVSLEAYPDAPFEVRKTLNEISVDHDVIVDFSHISVFDDVISYALKHKKPLVIASTGLNESHHFKIDEASQHIPIIQSGNYSMGVYALQKAVYLLAKILEDADLEIIEKHHRYKKDSPSGTAQMLIEALESQRGPLKVTYGREGQKESKPLNEVGLHSLRMGTVVGEHSVLFAMEDEVIEITHQASSKKIFAMGAFKAIRFIAKAAPGRYSLEDLVE